LLRVLRRIGDEVAVFVAVERVELAAILAVSSCADATLVASTPLTTPSTRP
jgi:hypothetical protein